MRRRAVLAEQYLSSISKMVSLIVPTRLSKRPSGRHDFDQPGKGFISGEPADLLRGTQLPALLIGILLCHQQVDLDIQRL